MVNNEWFFDKHMISQVLNYLNQSKLIVFLQ